MVALTKKPSTAKSSDTDVGMLCELRSRAERVAEGQSLRERVPRSSHATWLQPANRRDPVAILEQSSKGRLPELLPIRYGRMLHSPFTFMRGSAALMAHDLATTPSTGIRVQACGDCHLLNFGLFATPERIHYRQAFRAQGRRGQTAHARRLRTRVTCRSVAGNQVLGACSTITAWATTITRGEPDPIRCISITISFAEQWNPGSAHA